MSVNFILLKILQKILQLTVVSMMTFFIQNKINDYVYI